MRFYTAIALMAFACLLLFAAAGCSRYYLPVEAQASSAADKSNTIGQSKLNEKYFILRTRSGNFAMKEVQVNQQSQTLSCRLETLPEAHKHYIQFNRAYRYKKIEGEQVVLNEVHIYTSVSEPIDSTQQFTLALDRIQKIEVVEFDKARTTVSYVMGGVGISLGAVAVAAVIVALTKSSCPFVSVYDGQTFAVQGELFGGAIYPSLERQDLVALRARPIDGAFRIRISNELQEKQFTNYANLLVIKHAEGLHASTDPEGKIHVIGKTVAPVNALLNDRLDLTETVSATDSRNCLFDDTTAKNSINNLVLQFRRNEVQKEGRLVLQMKNSYWFDFLYGEFTKNFGSYYGKWTKKQKKLPASQMQEWTESQKIPMGISIKTVDGWKEVCRIKTIGPLLNREVVIPLDLSKIAGNLVEVKLTTGFMFWELDYAGMDYAPEAAFTQYLLQPEQAVDEEGRNVLPALLADDKQYLSQPQPGNEAILRYRFSEPLKEGEAFSVILQTKGYYEHVRHYTGKPRIAFLKSFKEPEAFTRFSRMKFEAVRTQNVIALQH